MSVLRIQRFLLEVNSVLEWTSALGDHVGEFSVGTHVGDKNITQVTTLLDGASDDVFGAVGSLRSPAESLDIILTIPVPGPRPPLTADVVEYVENTFQDTQVTSDFKRKIEGDFLKFESIYKGYSIAGHRGWAAGWTMRDVRSEGTGEGWSQSFVVMRGWDSMEAFQEWLGYARIQRSNTDPAWLAGTIPNGNSSPPHVTLAGLIVGHSGMLSGRNNILGKQLHGVVYICRAAPAGQRIACILFLSTSIIRVIISAVQASRFATSWPLISTV